MSTHDDRTATVAEIMEETDIAVLTYVSLDGHLVSTPMGTQDFEDPGTTWFLTDVYEVERQCVLGKDKYIVRFRGVPGASNAQWQCGGSSGAHATVWKNGRVVFDDEMAVCQDDSYIRKIVFSSGTDMPVITIAH